MTKHSDATISAANKTKAWITMLLADTTPHYTWRQIGDELGVSSSIAWQFYHADFIPKDNALRAKLKLPLVCQKCGEEVK